MTSLEKLTGTYQLAGHLPEYGRGGTFNITFEPREDFTFIDGVCSWGKAGSSINRFSGFYRLGSEGNSPGYSIFGLDVRDSRVSAVFDLKRLLVGEPANGGLYEGDYYAFPSSQTPKITNAITPDYALEFLKKVREFDQSGITFQARLSKIAEAVIKK